MLIYNDCMDFKDRIDAGQQLAQVLGEYKNQKDVVLVALPRGGVVLGRIAADFLGVPLDIVVPRKIGAPWSKEFAIGAIAESGEAVWDEAEKLKVSPQYIEETIKTEQAEAQRRLKIYREGLPPRDFESKIIIVVDDGIATGLTMRAAIASVRVENPKKIIVAVPASPQSSVEELKREADNVIAVMTPVYFPAVGAFYRDFPQVSDSEVIRLLRKIP